MTNIDWRAFWTSFATILIVLIIFFIVINPLIDKYNIKIVNPNKLPPGSASGGGAGAGATKAAA